MLTLWNQLDDLFNESPRRMNRSPRPTPESAGPAYVPPVDIEEHKEGFRFILDLPGVTADDVDIQLEGDVLTISGERKPRSGAEKECYRRAERTFGKFRRSFRLPKGALPEKISARVENGLLEVVVPQPTDKTPRKIRIGSA